MNVLVTTGPTRERIDPVRFISNFSTGIMGYEIARAARALGHRVTLISGPTEHYAHPRDVDFIAVESGREMAKAVNERFKRSDCVFMASAVCDWRPVKSSARKIKKTPRSKLLTLTPNPDILYRLGRRKGGTVLVGFALESEDLIRNAEEKLKNKNLDVIVANKVGGKNVPFGGGRTDAVIITKSGERKRFSGVTKKKLASYLVRQTEQIWRTGR